MSDKNIIPIWQPQGFSTHIIAKKVSEKLNLKTSHTGTLDPMAEGVIIVLSDEERNKKYEYAEWKKEYNFTIALGISTDSLDGLGLIKEVDLNDSRLQSEEISQVLENLEGNYTQKVPEFSAIKVAGKPMHWHYRNNNLSNIEIPEKSGTIYSAKLNTINEIEFKELREYVINKINNTSGDLRQDKCIESWNDLGISDNEKIQLLNITVETSKGLYIRQIAQDILKELGQIGFTYELIRTKNGIYEESNSITLSEYFGNNYLSEYDFESKTAK